MEEAPLPLQLSKEELAKMRQSMPDAWGSWGGDRRAPKKHAAHDNAAAAAIRAGRAVRAATAAARAAADVEACVESLIKKLEKEEAADQPTDQPASSTEEHQLRDAARRIREAEAAETVAAVQAEEEHYRHYIMKELTKKEVVSLLREDAACHKLHRWLSGEHNHAWTSTRWVQSSMLRDQMIAASPRAARGVPAASSRRRSRPSRTSCTRCA